MDISPFYVYNVMTGPAGFINHHAPIQDYPKCELDVHEDQVLGEHTLEVVCTKEIKEEKEWLLNYGPWSNLKVSKRRQKSQGQTQPK